MKKLEGKIAIVTGGTKGIGLATSIKLANEGAIVYACARNEAAFSSPKIHFRKIDVTDFASCNELYKFIEEKHGKIDVLVNNAGIMKDKTTKKMSNEEFDSVIATNVKGTFNMVKLFGPLMQKNRYGSIINVSSFVVKNGNIGQANYVASKSAIEGMTKCWARELTVHGENIRVNTIAPGVVLTDIFKDTPKEVVEGFVNRTCLKRLGQVEEIANVILFLASNDSSYITGSIIRVDGGIIL